MLVVLQDHYHSVHGARRRIPNKDEAKPKGEPRAKKVPRPKMASLKDNTHRWQRSLRPLIRELVKYAYRVIARLKAIPKRASPS